MEVELSEPIDWSQRGELPILPGVYVISRGGEVVYIGETKSTGGLRSRLALFHRAATTGKAKHSGGRTFYRMYEGRAQNLTIQFHGAGHVSPSIVGAYVEYIERRLIWEYAHRHGEIPPCNSK